MLADAGKARGTSFTNAVLAVAVTGVLGCSFVGVRGPVETTEPIKDPASVHCTNSDVLPSIDSIAGALALAAAVAGTAIEYASASGEPKHFDLYFGIPLVVIGIVDFSSASFGTNRVERCREIIENASSYTPVIPIEPSPPRKKPPEIDMSPP